MKNLLLLMTIALGGVTCLAQQPPPESAKSDRFLFGAQTTFIYQILLHFKSPYSGGNSLSNQAQGRLSNTYTLYLGARVFPGLEAYVDPEQSMGAGVGGAVGLADYTNGEVIRTPTLGQGGGVQEIPQMPYVARAFLRYTLATGRGLESIAKGENQIAMKRPTDRLVFTAGKLGVPDIFDQNNYASSTRTQFMSWALLNNAAFDYAADTRGYTEGAALEWIHPIWAARVGAFAMPRVANGPDLDPRLIDSNATQAELELHPRFKPSLDRGVVRLLAYRNEATMGDYAEALASGSTPPSITATRQRGRIKYGFGLNIEQALADAGDTGLFARLGWNDGSTESFAYTECDDAVSLGGQLSGKHWRMPNDTLGLAVNDNGISALHREYLGAGGTGFLLGDGKLHYGRETGFEAYCKRKLGQGWEATLDGQLIVNPGYNQDRGPVPVLSLRVHWEL